MIIDARWRRSIVGDLQKDGWDVNRIGEDTIEAEVEDWHLYLKLSWNHVFGVVGPQDDVVGLRKKSQKSVPVNVDYGTDVVAAVQRAKEEFERLSEPFDQLWPLKSDLSFQ